jgi:hypothetical protein
MYVSEDEKDFDPQTYPQIIIIVSQLCLFYWRNNEL